MGSLNIAVYSFSGRSAGGLETAPLLNRKLEPQQLSVAVKRFTSDDTNPHVLDGSNVQCLS